MSDSEHSKLPWTAKGDMVYLQTPDACLMIAKGPEWKTEKGFKLVKANMQFIAKACNSHAQLKAKAESQPALLAACETALGMLTHVACIQGCGGSGAIQISEDDVEQCQWCDELDSIKAAIKGTGK